MRQLSSVDLRRWVDQQSRNLAADGIFGPVQQLQMAKSLDRLGVTSGGKGAVSSPLAQALMAMALGQAIEQQSRSGASGDTSQLEQPFLALVAEVGQGGSASALQAKSVKQTSAQTYLAIQRQMQEESRRYCLLSNIMKVAHDTAMNSINNMR